MIIGDGWRIHIGFIADYRHKVKLADGISDGIVGSGLLKFTMHQRVTAPGDYCGE
jgi:hypothetical protein